MGAILPSNLPAPINLFPNFSENWLSWQPTIATPIFPGVSNEREAKVIETQVRPGTGKIGQVVTKNCLHSIIEDFRLFNGENVFQESYWEPRAVLQFAEVSDHENKTTENVLMNVQEESRVDLHSATDGKVPVHHPIQDVHHPSGVSTGLDGVTITATRDNRTGGSLGSTVEEGRIGTADKAGDTAVADGINGNFSDITDEQRLLSIIEGAAQILADLNGTNTTPSKHGTSKNDSKRSEDYWKDEFMSEFKAAVRENPGTIDSASGRKGSENKEFSDQWGDVMHKIREGMSDSSPSSSYFNFKGPGSTKGGNAPQANFNVDGNLSEGEEDLPDDLNDFFSNVDDVCDFLQSLSKNMDLPPGGAKFFDSSYTNESEIDQCMAPLEKLLDLYGGGAEGSNKLFSKR